jgi:hypothetical protein
MSYFGLGAPPLVLRNDRYAKRLVIGRGSIIWSATAAQINMSTWIHGRNEANLQLSTNGTEDIEQTLKYRIPTGGAASVENV